MKMKKVLAILLVLCFTLSVMAGCGGTGTSTDANASSVAAPDGNTAESEASGDAVAPTGEVVKLTALFTKHALTKELSKMEWLQKAEADAGVKIEWEEISSDWAQKKATLLAGGDIPDLVVGNGSILDTEFAQFPGLFEDLSSLLVKYAPNVQAMFSDHPETKIIATQLDGKIYGLPKYQRYWPSTVTRQYINQKWLDNLGLAVPTNWDELYSVLLAFKEKDANGNGDPNDEIPMDFAPGNFGFFQPTVLMGSLGITLTDASANGLFLEGGKVKSFFTDERYKMLVQFLNKCFAAGLINKEVFTQDYTKFQSVARGNGDVAAVGFSWGWDVTDRFGNALAPQYKSMGQIKQSASSNAKLSWDYDYNTLNYGMNCIQMSAQCKNKEAAMKFINQLYDPIVSMQVLFGSIGPNIKDNGDGSYAVLPPEDPNMDPGTWKWTSSWADNGAMNIADTLNLTLGTDMQAIDEQMKDLKPIIEGIDKDNDVLPSMFMKYSVDDNATMGTNNTNIMNTVMAKWAQWITAGGIENEWDEYVKNCEKAGLLQNIEIVQKNYDTYKSK
jgi:putative aldouronate transport system substrate-binding protein